MNIARVGRGLLCAAVLLGAGSLAAEPWPPPPETPAVLLHPDLPEVLDARWILRLELFPEVIDLQRVRFGLAPWGAVLARLEVDDGDTPPRILVRSLAAETWRELRQRAAIVMAGEPLPPVALDGGPPPVDPLSEARAWPEAPAPPTAPYRELLSVPGRAVPVRGQWLALVEAGLRGNVSEFNSFFTPMGQVGVAFAHGVTERFVPSLAFAAGFGDMRGDFEDVYGDGRTNAFNLTLTALLRQPLGGRHSLYLEGGGGYFIRSLYWGSAFYNPATGDVTEGRVIEQSQFGWTGRFGWLLRRDHPRRPQFLDVGVGVQTSVADPWVFTGDEASFTASERDTWIFLTVRFWDGI